MKNQVFYSEVKVFLNKIPPFLFLQLIRFQVDLTIKKATTSKT